MSCTLRTCKAVRTLRRVRNKNAPQLRIVAIGRDFVFGQKGAQRAAEGTSPRLFSLHSRRCRFS
jgi:hypothetical protein